MPAMPSSVAQTVDGASCAIPRRRSYDAPSTAADGFLSGGCCSDAEDSSVDGVSMSSTARRTRALAGLGFLALAGALSSRQLPGRIDLWPAALVPTWFGISHLVAGVTGYQGCPELGAIPSVMLDRQVRTACRPWQRIDARLALPTSSSACCR